jgi:hypothetical protein
VKQFRFRALVTVEVPARGGPGRQYPSGTRALMVHARRIGQPSCDKYFPASICRDDGLPLRPGQRAIVTITVTGDDAAEYLGSGQPFTLWGGGAGHGIISRQVFTASGPS